MIIIRLFIEGNKNGTQELTKFMDVCVCACARVLIRIQRFMCPDIPSIFSIQIAD